MFKTPASVGCVLRTKLMVRGTHPTLASFHASVLRFANGAFIFSLIEL